MNMRDVVFDPTDLRTKHNPPFLKHPLKIDVSCFVGRTIYLDPRRVKPMEDQPRKDFKRIKRLATGIKSFGQNTPIRVHPFVSDDYDAELEAGERRTKACIDAGLMIRAEIYDVPVDNKEHFVTSFVENFNREPLTTLETVRSIQRLLADGHSRSDIADMSGKTYSWVVQFATLGNLHPDILPFLDERKDDQRNASGRKLRRTTVLPLSIALQVVKMPLEEQLPFVLATIEDARSINDARRMVERRMEEIGMAGTVRKRSARDRFGTLERQISSFGSFIGRYLDMPVPEMRKFFESQEKSDLEMLASSMRELSMHLKSIAQIAHPLPVSGSHTRG